jgi:hypothetical protein
MKEQLIQGINKVTLAWETYIKNQSNRVDRLPTANILLEIRRVADLVSKFEKKTLSNDREICKAIGDISYKMLLQFPKLNIPATVKEISIFKAINRGDNENLHSDFIASLLNPRITGIFAKELFFELINYAKSTKASWQGEWKYQTVQREINLSVSEHGKRLDILVKSNDRVLAIENKVYSLESENQTLDYFDLLNKKYGKSLVCLFLSPTGMSARCQAFRPISYLKLFEFLIDIRKKIQVEIPVQGEELYAFYLQELAETIIRPTIKANKKTENFLKGMGYGSN